MSTLKGAQVNDEIVKQPEEAVCCVLSDWLNNQFA